MDVINRRINQFHSTSVVNCNETTPPAASTDGRHIGLLARKWRAFRLRKVSSLRCGILTLLGVLFLIVFHYRVVRYFFLDLHSSNIDVLQVKNCPACFGHSACAMFLRGEVRFTEMLGRYPLLHNFNQRGVFYGALGGMQPLRIKRLMDPERALNVKERLCHLTDLTGEDCTESRAVWRAVGKDDSHHHGLHLTQIHKVSSGGTLSCVSQRGLQQLMLHFSERNPGSSHRALLPTEEMQFLYTAAMNPEPLLLSFFSAEKGWPVPRLLGTCGIWTVEEDMGNSLAEWRHESLSDRFELAAQLLNLSLVLSENDENLAMYLMKVEWDMFAVRREASGGLVLRLVDLRFVLLVDLSANYRTAVHKTAHSRLCKHPEHCVLDSKLTRAALCSASVSDHNIYSVCRELLSPKSIVPGSSSSSAAVDDDGSLFSDLSKGASQSHAELLELIEACVADSTRDRTHTAKQLINLLKHSI